MFKKKNCTTKYKFLEVHYNKEKGRANGPHGGMKIITHWGGGTHSTFAVKLLQGE